MSSIPVSMQMHMIFDVRERRILLGIGVLVGLIMATYAARAEEEKYAYVADLKEIKENDFNLNIPRYVDTFEDEEEIDIDAVQVEIDDLEKELAAVRVKMAEKLKEIQR